MMQTGTLVVLWALAGSALFLVVSAYLPPRDRFDLFHVRPNPLSQGNKYCNDQMRYALRQANKLNPTDEKICKQINTFIHDSTDAIRAVCGRGGSDYRTSRGEVMRRSKQSFQITTCTLRGGTPLKNCDYWATKSFSNIVIACDTYGNPVHLDETHIRVRRGGGASGSS